MKWPSIPQPQTDGQSLQTSLLALKENVELIQGVRGQSPFILASSAQSYDDQLAQIKKDRDAADKAMQARLDKLETGFRPIVNQKLTGFTNFDVKDLAIYSIVNIYLHAYPTPTAGTLILYCSADNGATFYQNAGAYAEEIIYSTNSSPTPAVTSTGDVSNAAGWGLRPGGFGGNLQVNGYGVRTQLTMMGMEYSYTTFQGNLSYINSTPTLLYGQYTARIGAGVNCLRFSTLSNPYNGRLFMEGVLR